MKIGNFVLIALTGAFISFTSCKKDDEVVLQPPGGSVVEITDETVELKGLMKGTLRAGKTYQMVGDVIIPAGEQLVAEAGVTVIVNVPEDDPGYEFTVNGSFISLGTEQNPNLFTVPQNLRTDANVFAGLWGGWQGSSTTSALVFKWTRMEYLGAEGGPGTPRAGRIRYGLWTLSDQTEVVLENSWIYGTADDFFRPVGGKLNIVGNTFELCGFDGGDIINVKGGTVGNIAYNVAIGSATNAFKPSDDGDSPIQTNIAVFNNTIVNGGHRRAGLNRGSNINFEVGARGKAFNNIIVNCKNGIRILEDADHANINYDHNWFYANSQELADEFLPTDAWNTAPRPNDVMGNAGDNDPIFVNFDVTTYSYADFQLGPNQPLAMNRMSGENHNLRLSSSSPAIGAGTTNFTPVNVNWTLTGAAAPTIPQPSIDMGAYPSNGQGNKHN